MNYSMKCVNIYTALDIPMTNCTCWFRLFPIIHLNEKKINLHCMSLLVVNSVRAHLLPAAKKILLIINSFVNVISFFTF